MDLKIKYENGSMTVHLEEFLNCRSISKVKKLVKLIHHSANPDDIGKIRMFVEQKIEQFEPKQMENTRHIIEYTEKVKYTEQQVKISQWKLELAEHEIKVCQAERDSHRRGTKVWKSCDKEVKRMRAELKGPKNELKEQKEKLKNFKILLRKRQKDFDNNIRNKEFYKKVLENIT